MKIRGLLMALPILFSTTVSANAQLSVGMTLPGITIGINMPTYPTLVVVPGSPVYYAPRSNSNYFFYDGLYWVYQENSWYASSWYNGPWQLTEPDYVPAFILRIPVRYYHRPPAYFRGWHSDAPPHWGEHWGRDWETRRNGWDRWDPHAKVHAAPLPVYQRQYVGAHYPRTADQQQAIQSEKYRYQPQEVVGRSHFQQQGNAENARVDSKQQTQHAQPVPEPESRHEPQRQTPPEEATREHGQRAESPDMGRDRKFEPHDRGRNGKNEEHGQERR